MSSQLSADLKAARALLVEPRERPILFSSAMVRAILAGEKTQTRRLIRDPDRGTCQGVDTFEHVGQLDDGSWMFTSASPLSEWRADPNMVDYLKGGGFKCPYGAPGDRLWVRETWDFRDWSDVDDAHRARIAYGADGEQVERDAPADWNPTIYNHERWRPSIHMPRWASRITLDVTAVRVERLNDITEKDAWAEGTLELDGTIDDAKLYARAQAMGEVATDARVTFAELWDTINGKRASWASNPWVWVVSFRRATGGAGEKAEVGR